MAKTAKKKTLPTPIEESPKDQALRIQHLKGEFECIEDKYVFDDSFKAGNSSDFRSVHTIPEMMSCLEKNPEIEAEGIFLEADKEGHYRYRKFQNKKQIQEAWNKNAKLKKFREVDTFATDGNSSTAGANAGLVGDDFVPLLGGPFNKQPYLYDYLRAHAYCFHEYHHHPFARAIINITRDFVLGRGYRIDSDDDKALVLWRAFEKVNGLESMMEDIVKEGSAYGENMIWWIPGQKVYITYNLSKSQEPAMGIIPRIRMIDPSTCWEIVTFPEDIKRVLFYWLVFPTQYQIKTGTFGGSPVPTAKFITQQIPASDIMHFKYNSMSNEKRGRSDLFPVLGYLKWVRDVVNYKLIAAKKQAAWTEDISVEGSQTDVNNLADSLANLGEFEPAGSRFIHTKKIERKYLDTAMGHGGKDETLDWGINMIAAGTQIPVTYFGLSHSAGQTRASALVGTEPVAKKMERRQLEVTRILQAIWKKFQDEFGVKGAECSITFPEIITQDSQEKIKSIAIVKDEGAISHERASLMMVKEIGVGDDYDYDEEQEDIQAEQEIYKPSQTIITPLTTPAQTGGTAPSDPSSKPQTSQTPSAPDSTSAVTKNQRHALDRSQTK